MSKPYLQLARPLPVEHPTSREFMLTKLGASGLTPEDLGAYPVAPIGMNHIPGFLIPYHDPNMYRIRYDRLVDKYIGPKGRVGVWWSPHDDIETFRSSPIVYIVEGELKAAALRKRFPGLKVLGIGGCWMFRVKHDNGTETLMPDILRAVAPGQVVHVIFDGDIENKIGIQQAAHTLNGLLEMQNSSVQLFKPPIGKGVDDWLVADPLAQLSHLKPVSIASLEISRKSLYKKLQLKTNEKGNIILNELNAYRLLQDHFAGSTFKDRRLGVIHNGNTYSGDIMYQGLQYLQDQISSHFTPSTVRHACNLVFEDNERDLVQELVKSLEWDGVPRLNTWGSEYFETDWPEYANEWGRLLMTGLALRILRPGTKVDHCCILVGAQGIGKSTFFEALASFGGFTFYHACTKLEEGESRDQATAFKRALVVDLAEGVVFNSRKSNTDIMKQVISQVEDQHREVYAKVTSSIQRGFIFVGTTNRRDQLADLTGSRRFLNLEAKSIKYMDYDYKLQLLAEVVHHEEAIRESPWYELKVDMTTAPSELLEEFGHIKNAQELVNTQFHKSEATVDFITNLLDSGNAARVTTKSGEHMFLTAEYVNNLMGQSGPQSTNYVSRMLIQLTSAPAYKYEAKSYRVRVPQFQFSTPQQKEAYLGTYTDSKRMVAGYLFQPKALQILRSAETLQPHGDQVH